MNRLLIALFLLVAPCLAQGGPNIVIIFADDLGYGDVQAYNPESKIPTPAMNALAENGVRFTDAHTTSAVCTPSRYSLLTGRYCWRSRLKRGVLYPPKDQPLIESDRPSIASYLKSHGYRTGMVGKWHLGIGWAQKDGQADYTADIVDGPNEKGFDSWYGIAASLDMEPYTYIRDHRIEPLSGTQEKLGFPRYLREGPIAEDFDHSETLDVLAREAGDFICRNAGTERPFFLYLPITSPHKPVWPHSRFAGKTGLGPYGDFVYQTDHFVGQIMQSLEQAQVSEHTLVLLTSDNGSFMFSWPDRKNDHVDDATKQYYHPHRHLANGSLRGTKADIYEGGHRVPLIVSWPKAFQSQISDRTISVADIFATLADLIGQPQPEAAEDSYSFLPTLRGRKSPARPPVIMHSSGGMFAIRSGDYKLILGDGSGGREKPNGKPFKRPFQLYNLATDPGETTNLVRKHPELEARLIAEFEEIYGEKVPN